MWDFDELSTNLSVSVWRMFLSFGNPSYSKLTSNSTIFLNVNGIWANETSVSIPASKNMSIKVA